MKKFLALILVLAMALCLFAGCGSKKTDDELTVAVVVAGAFGDRSFYDSSKAGLDMLVSEYGIKPVTIECNNENHDTQMRNAADAADVVVCVGWEFYEIENIAPEYPDVKWIWIDNATSEPLENVLNITYAQNEGSFLAGYIAAAMTQSGVVGAVGGEDSDTINDFMVGYRQGAEYYGNAKGKIVNVVNNYTNDYDDPAKGKECAKALADSGADVIFQIASKAGDGVFEAAQEGGFYAIGVDSDQKYIADDVIICSMRKQVGLSIYDAVSRLIGGDAGQWGSTWVADTATGYVGIAYGEAGSTQQISDDIKNEVAELTEKIISGEIVVNSVF